MGSAKSIFWKSAASHGLIVGLILIILAVITWVGDLEESRAIGWANMLISVGAIYYTMKHWRDHHKEGVISYGQALGYGVAVMFMASIVFGFYNVIYLNYLNPEAVAKSLDLVEESYYQMGFSEDKTEMLMEMAQTLQTPFFHAFSVILGFTFRGLLISLITALFVKKEGDPFQTAMKDVD